MIASYAGCMQLETLIVKLNVEEERGADTSAQKKTQTSLGTIAGPADKKAQNKVVESFRSAILP